MVLILHSYVVTIKLSSLAILKILRAYCVPVSNDDYFYCMFKFLKDFVLLFFQTATIQVLKKAGRPSERLVSHENCRFTQSTGHECMHIQQITEESGTEEAEADSEYDNALKEAVKGIQDAVLAINEYLEEIRYEIAALEGE